MMSSSFCASRSLLTLLGSEAKRYETFVNTNYVLNLCEASIHPYVDFNRIIPFSAHPFLQISCTAMRCALSAFDQRKKDEL